LIWSQAAKISRYLSVLFAVGIWVSVAPLAVAGDHPEMMAPPHSPKVEKYTNHLIHESSPYLLQHAHNPVDWYPWGEEAFARARREDRPIFLSIGYSTCHWCHVMEAEVFSDPEAAALINRLFIAIKVDREERPDIDQVYMTVSQMLTGSGGWPLNLFLTPDRKPFYAGTYIPKHSRFGRVGIMELVPRVEVAWRQDRKKIDSSAEQITVALRNMNQEAVKRGTFTNASLDQTYQNLVAEYDSGNGGFGQQRKFPMSQNLRYLLRHWWRTGDKKALEMVEKTLTAMRRGGIYDQVGFGFHRYSTDRAWKLPHFEKMLYDQALIAMACIEAYTVTGKKFYADTAREIFTYVLRDMTSPEGVFYSAEDADSEGEEGLFYLWTRSEIQQVLDKKTAALFNQVYNIKNKGNFADEASGRSNGRNILFLNRSWSELASQTGIPEPELKQQMGMARKKLLEKRATRLRPLRDDKVLTDWNGLMIAALAMGARVLQEPAYARAAHRAADFILGQMRNSNGHMLHRWHKGQAGITATLDDYAFFVWGLIELYRSSFSSDLLAAALQLNRIMIRDFEDKKQGGLFLTAATAEALLVRPKEISDGALPSGNSVALLNMLRLARLTGSADLEAKAQGISSAFFGMISRAPAAYANFMIGVGFSLSKGHEVVIVGDPNAADTRAMLQALNRKFLPDTVVLLRSDGDHTLDKLAPFTKFQKSLDGKATAYVCQDFACNKPTTDINKVLKLVTGSVG